VEGGLGNGLERPQDILDQVGEEAQVRMLLDRGLHLGSLLSGGLARQIAPQRGGVDVAVSAALRFAAGAKLGGHTVPLVSSFAGREEVVRHGPSLVSPSGEGQFSVKVPVQTVKER
jgi:hypothetical protein